LSHQRTKGEFPQEAGHSSTGLSFWRLGIGSIAFDRFLEFIYILRHKAKRRNRREQALQIIDLDAAHLRGARAVDGHRVSMAVDDVHDVVDGAEVGRCRSWFARIWLDTLEREGHIEDASSDVV